MKVQKKYIRVAKKNTTGSLALTFSLILLALALVAAVVYILYFFFVKTCKISTQRKCYNPFDSHRFRCDPPPPTGYQYNKFTCRYHILCPNNEDAYVPNVSSPVTSVRVNDDGEPSQHMACGKRCDAEPSGFCKVEETCTDKGCYKKPSEACDGEYICDISTDCVLNGVCESPDVFKTKNFQNVGTCSNPTEHPKNNRCVQDLHTVGEKATGEFANCNNEKVGISQRIRQCNHLYDGCADSVCPDGWQGIYSGAQKDSDCDQQLPDVCTMGEECSIACCSKEFKAQLPDGTRFCCDVETSENEYCTNSGAYSISFVSVPKDTVLLFVNANTEELSLAPQDVDDESALANRLRIAIGANVQSLAIPISVLSDGSPEKILSKFVDGSSWKVVMGAKQYIWKVTTPQDSTLITALQDDNAVFNELFLQELNISDHHPKSPEMSDGSLNPYFAFLSDVVVQKYTSPYLSQESSDNPQNIVTFKPHCGISFDPSTEQGNHKLFVFDNESLTPPFSFCSTNDTEECKYSITKPLNRILSANPKDNYGYTSNGHLLCHLDSDGDDSNDLRWSPANELDTKAYTTTFKIDYVPSDGTSGCSRSQKEFVNNAVRSVELPGLNVEKMSVGKNAATFQIKCSGDTSEAQQNQTRSIYEHKEGKTIEIPWSKMNTFDSLSNIAQNVFNGKNNVEVCLPYNISGPACFDGKDWEKLHDETGFGATYSRIIAEEKCYRLEQLEGGKAMANGKYCMNGRVGLSTIPTDNNVYKCLDTVRTEWPLQ